LGFKLEERLGHRASSVVVEVADNSQAKYKGVRVGYVVVGINSDPFLSHAHAVATLKHVRRPVIVRFKK
jgi:C-terminal processing protease CtpA/Prc